MYSNIKQAAWTTYNLTLFKFRLSCLLLRYILFFHKVLRNFSKFFNLTFLSRQIFSALTVVILLFISFSNYAFISKTANIIHGSAPYLTFDGGRTRVTNSDGMLGISLSDGTNFTPITNNSSLTNPIELPEIGQSFADISMLIPTNVNSISLSTLIDSPYNYWGDDDGDGLGINGITAIGSLSLSIVDKNNEAVARNEVLTVCKAPYRLILSNTNSTLKTRYGVPNERRFSESSAIYYVNPKATPVICFAKPDMRFSRAGFAGPSSIWDSNSGFLPQSIIPSSYHLNFPTTGANNLYFDLVIGGNNEALYWAPVSHGGITATMTNSINTSVRVTLTGPVAKPSQWSMDNPGNIDSPSLPQVFELVGRDSPGGDVIVKYGFVLKQWFVNRGLKEFDYSSSSSWCTNIGYRLPKVKDLTNATCRGGYNCQGAVGATPSSPNNFYQRYINAGLFTEWGSMNNFNGSNFRTGDYWTSERNDKYQFTVTSINGIVTNLSSSNYVICTYP